MSVGRVIELIAAAADKLPAPVWDLVWQAIKAVIAGKPDEAAIHIRAAAIRASAKASYRRRVPR